MTVASARYALVPIALLVGYLAPSAHLAAFVLSALAIIVLANDIGEATEHAASKLGAGLGGLLNATFGNAAELAIGALALRRGLHDLVTPSRWRRSSSRSSHDGETDWMEGVQLIAVYLILAIGFLFSARGLGTERVTTPVRETRATSRGRSGADRQTPLTASGR